MSINPTDLPAAIYGPITPLPPTPWVAARDNNFTVASLLNHTGLPAPVKIARPDAVYITVADIDDLGLWLDERGGEIHVSPEFDGMRTWVLHTSTEPRTDGSTVAIRVAVTVVADEPVMHDIRAAVATRNGISTELRARIRELEALAAGRLAEQRHQLESPTDEDRFAHLAIDHPENIASVAAGVAS